ncbi:hypothetical protein OAG82_03510 [Rubripirellula sp.]|nr:hypothetical protein [Rubripirellula sp.]
MPQTIHSQDTSRECEGATVNGQQQISRGMPPARIYRTTSF